VCAPDRAQPDVVCLQEIKCSADAFPGEGAIERGYEVAAYGDGRWHGVAILSRVGLEQVSRGFAAQPGYAAPTDEDDLVLVDVPAPPVVEARAIAATCGAVRLWSVYVPNGRSLDSPHFSYKLEWLAPRRKPPAGGRDARGAVLPPRGFHNAHTS